MTPFLAIISSSNEQNEMKGKAGPLVVEVSACQGMMHEREEQNIYLWNFMEFLLRVLAGLSAKKPTERPWALSE